MHQRDRNRKGESVADDPEAKAQPQGPLGQLVERLGPAAAQVILRRHLALKRSQGAAAPANATEIAETGVSGPSSPLPAARAIAPHLGADLDGVRAHFGPRAEAACDALGAQAYTLGDQVAFREASPSVGLQAHEATHVVQQGAAPTDAPQRFSAASPNAEERQADAVAVAVAGPGALPARDESAWQASGGGKVQRFAPPGHRAATISGLEGSFGPEEIGQIYAANWERDFSQGNAKIADLVLSWKAVKLAAGGQGDFQTASTRFQSAIATVISMGKLEATDESLGGYQPWEHLDNPGGDAANKRWKLNKEQAQALPGYIRDGKAYLQDEMVAAVNAYRARQEMTSAGNFDPWQGAQKPKGYDQPKKVKDPTMSRDVIATDTANLTTEQLQASVQPRRLDGGKEAFAASAEHLGRATHVLEDFFAHSNWLELAKQMKQPTESGGSKAPKGNLITGTFEMADKCHALGHKLLAISAELQKDFALLLKVFGREQASTELDKPEHKKEKQKVLGALDTNSSTLLGEIFDVASAAGDANTVSKKGKLTLADIATNKDWLASLQRKGLHMIEHGDGSAPETGHGKLAKDQDEPNDTDHKKDYAGAHALATAADRLVIAPLAAAMQTVDGDEAHTILAKQLVLVDQIVAPPTMDHPLIHLVTV